MYVHPVPLIENTPPWATATGSTATVAIGQIVAMKRRHVHLAPEVPRRCDVAHQQQHREHPEDVALQRGVAAGRRTQKHERHAPEREHREHQGARVDVLAEEPGPDGHDQKRRARPDQGRVRDAVVRRPGKEHRQVQPEEDPGDPHLAHVAQRHATTRAPQDDVPREAHRGQAPERKQHTGRLGTLDQRRTERKRDHQPKNREHPERLRAQRTDPRRSPRCARNSAHPRTLTGAQPHRPPRLSRSGRAATGERRAGLIRQTRRSTETVRPASSRSTASTARWSRLPKRATPRASATSSCPRMRNSIRAPGGTASSRSRRRNWRRPTREP